MSGIIAINSFIETCKKISQSEDCPVDKVNLIIPLMGQLISESDRWLTARHLKSCEDAYARNLVYLDENNELGLYVLVWKPGQWTPIHDHGTWGVVGVIRGEHFCEHNYVRDKTSDDSLHTNIQLHRGGSIMMAPGTVTSFVANPDHIHIAGNPGTRDVVTLHLYGNAMSGFHIYDIENKSRTWYKADHQ